MIYNNNFPAFTWRWSLFVHDSYLCPLPTPISRPITKVTAYNAALIRLLVWLTFWILSVHKLRLYGPRVIAIDSQFGKCSKTLLPLFKAVVFNTFQATGHQIRMVIKLVVIYLFCLNCSYWIFSKFKIRYSHF